MTRIEQIQRALQRAQSAGDTAAVQEIQSLLDRESAYEALRVSEQTPSTADPINQREIDRRMATAAEEGLAARDKSLGFVEGVGRGIAGGAISTGAFLQGAIQDPIMNTVEWAEAGLTGREPQYRSRYAEGLQAAQNVMTPAGREVGLAGQVGLGTGQAIAMLPEMFTGGTAGRVVRTGEQLLSEGAQTLPQVLAREAETAARAQAILAPRLGSQTTVEAEQAGATPGEALVAGIADMGATALTGVLPVAARGNLGTRLATGAVGGVAAEAGTQGVVNPFLPTELAAQRDITNPENLTTAGVLGAGMGALFGTRPLTRAQRVEQQRLQEISQADPAVGAGIQAAESIAAEAPAPRSEITRQEALAFPEREPTMVDMFSGEERPAVAPEPRNLGLTEDLVQARTELDNVLNQDRAVRQAIQEIEANPRGEEGRLSRTQRTKIKALREQANQLGIQAEVARAKVREAGAVEEAAVPSGATPEETRRNYLLQMQARQFDRVERERLGEMGGLGATETGTVFQPTKPRIRVEAEPVQESLPLTKPRVRVGEDLTQQPVPLEVSRQRWQEGPTGDLFGEAPVRSQEPIQEAPLSFTTAKGSVYEVGPGGSTTRTKAARDDVGHEGDFGKKPTSSRTVYVDSDVGALSAAGLSNLGEKGARVIIQDGKATLLTWNEKEGRWGSSPSSRDIPISDTPAVGKSPLELWNKADDVGGVEAYSKMHAGNKIVSVSTARQPQPATTVAPDTQTAPVEAPRGSTVDATVSRPAVQSEPVTGRTVTEEIVTEEGIPTQTTITEPAVEPTNQERAALEEYFTSSLTRRAVSPEVNEVVRRIQNQTLRPDQRVPTPLRQVLNRSKTAWDALAGVRAVVKMGADPKIERYDRLVEALTTEDMKNIEFQILQPESRARTRAQQSVKDGVGVDAFTRGMFEVDPATGKGIVTVTGDGFSRRDGTGTVEITLHEIVHAKTAQTINAVKNRTETDPAIVQAVNDLEAIRSTVRKNIPKEGLTKAEQGALDYATENVDEFLSGTLSNPLVQSALKKQGLWDKIVNIIRTILRIPRSQKTLLDEVLDASYAVVDAVNQRNQREGGATQGGPVEPKRATRAERNTRREAGLPALREASPKEDYGTKGITSLEGLRNAGGASKEAFVNAFHKMLTPTQGTDTRVKLAEKLAMGTKQEFDLVVEAFMNRIGNLRDTSRLDDKDRKSVNDRVMNYLRGNTSALDPVPGERNLVRSRLGKSEVKAALDDVRKEIDQLSARIGNELVRAYEGKDMPQSVLNTLNTLKTGMGVYLSRVYESFVNKNYSKDLMSRYEKGDETAVATVGPLVNRLTNQIQALGENLETARGIAASENLALKQAERKETKKPWTKETWDKVSDIPLERLYGDLIGSPVVSREQMFNQLQQWFDNNVKDKGDLERSKKAALQVTRDILGVAGRDTPLSVYWRNLRSDDRALKKLQDVPTDVRKALGEIQDPVMRVAFTLSRQSAALAALKQNNDLFVDAPDKFRTQSERDPKIHNHQIPNNPVVYGKLAGLYTDKLTHDFLVARQGLLPMFDGVGEWIDLLGQAKTGPEKIAVVAAGAGKAAVKASGIGKFFSIVASTGNFLMDTVGAGSFIVRSGNFDPSTYVKGASLAKEFFGTGFRTKYSEEARRLMRLGVIDPALTQVDEQVRQAMRETEISERLKRSANPTGEFLQKGWAGAVSTAQIIRDARAYLENAPKIANFLNNEKFLTKAFPDLSKAEIEKLAAEKTLRTEINYAMAPGLVKALETSQISYIAAFYSESLRTGVMNYIEAVREIRSGNPVMRQLGVQRLLGVTAGLAGMSYMLGTVLANSLGAMEDLEEDWPYLSQFLGFTQQGQMKRPMDVSDDLTVTSVDFGRLDGMDIWTMQMRNVVDILNYTSEGNDDLAIETSQRAITGLIDSFTGGSPIGTAVVNTVSGRQPKPFMKQQFPEWYDGTVANLSELVGSEKAIAVADRVSSMLDFVTPGAAKQYIRGLASGDVQRNESYNVAQMLGMPVTYDNPLRSLSGAKASEYLRTRNGAGDVFENLVTLMTDKNVDETIRSATEAYIDTQREAYSELSKYVRTAKAVGNMAGLPEAEVRARIYETLRANNGFPRTEAQRLADGEPFRPTAPNAKTFLSGAIERRLRDIQTDTREGRLRRERAEELFNTRRDEIIDSINARILTYKEEE